MGSGTIAAQSESEMVALLPFWVVCRGNGEREELAREVTTHNLGRMGQSW